MKINKSKLTVTECAEFKCCFFHADSMGGQSCTAVQHKAHFLGDLPYDEAERPPAWCPLKQGPITIKFK
jgi:hypothetical protein